jgi:hypothetical protein
MGDTFLLSGLKEKRSAIVGQIADLYQQIDKLQAALVHVDGVLQLYGLEPSEIPTKGRMPVRSTYFGRNEISRRCREMLRLKGVIRADDVAVQAMLDKRLDPEKNRKIRTDFSRRILVTLHDLRKADMIEKVGHGRGVQWRAIDPSASEPRN